MASESCEGATSPDILGLKTDFHICGTRNRAQGLEQAVSNSRLRRVTIRNHETISLNCQSV